MNLSFMNFCLFDNFFDGFFLKIFYGAFFDHHCIYTLNIDGLNLPPKVIKKHKNCLFKNISKMKKKNFKYFRNLKYLKIFPKTSANFVYHTKKKL